MQIKRRKKVAKLKNIGKSYNKELSATKGLTHDSLLKSRAIRSRFMLEHGFIPSSILDHNPSVKSIDFARGYKHVMSIMKKHLASSNPLLLDSGMKTQGYTNPRDGSGMSDREYGNSVLSKFSQNVGRFIVKFYCPEGGVVFDPFAGHNSRMQLVFESGRHYYGCDISKEFMQYNRAIRKYLIAGEKRSLFSAQKKIPTIKLFEQSSDRVKQLKDDFADFTITSPPYWDIEYYGPEKQQLGMSKSYSQFINSLSQHAKENYRILKTGSFCCWFINDFRKNSKFYPYHIDVYNMLRDAGFTPFNIYIVKLPSITKQFLQGTIKRKLLPKVHEYIVVMKKK